MGMRRWGRTVAALVVGAAVSATLAGCIGPFATQDVQVAAPGIDAACIVGTWQLAEGWQRVSWDSGKETYLLFIQGTPELTISRDGTGKVTYPKDTLWRGEDPDSATEMEAAFTGTGTLTYSAVNGDWRQVSDLTKRTLTISRRGVGTPEPGTANSLYEGTYRCDAKQLIIAGKDTRYVYTRTA